MIQGTYKHTHIHKMNFSHTIFILHLWCTVILVYYLKTDVEITSPQISFMIYLWAAPRSPCPGHKVAVDFPKAVAQWWKGAAREGVFPQ